MRELNDLAVSVGAKTVAPKTVKWQKVERLIGILEGRCRDDARATALRSAAEKWVSNGGKLSYGLTAAASQTSGVDATPVLPFHKLLIKGFRLETHACMLTFNSADFRTETWATYVAWVEDVAKRLGARAWAACLEESTHASGAAWRCHLHGYLYWQGGDGLKRQNTDDLVFENVRPRIDLCNRTNVVRLRAAASHGLFYVYLKKLGTLQSASNFLPWRDYTPKPDWLDALWMAHKLTHAQYNEYSVTFRSGHAKRKRDVIELVRSDREHTIDDHVKKEEAAVTAH